MKTSIPHHWIFLLAALAVLFVGTSTGPLPAQADPALAGPLGGSPDAKSCAIPAEPGASAAEIAALGEQLANEAREPGEGTLLNGNGYNYGSPGVIENQLLELDAALQEAR